MNNVSMIKLSALAEKMWVENKNYSVNLPKPTDKQIIYITTDNRQIIFDIENDVNNTITNFLAKIESHVFNGSFGIINFKDTVTTLECFNRQDTLKEIYYPNTVTSIGVSAFNGCTSLSNFEFLDSIESIGQLAFSGCESLTEIYIPKSVTKIDMQAFYKCSGLKSVDIDAQITDLQQMTFWDCSKLESVKLSDTIEIINGRVFGGASSLKKLKCPSNLKIIDSYAFENCYELEEIEFNDTLSVINSNAFEQCKKVKKLEFPSSLQNMMCSFYGCTALEYVRLPFVDKIVYNTSFLDSNIYVKKVEFIEGTEKIPEFICRHCVSLEEVIIPESVTSIENAAFQQCLSLSHINLPSKLETIGSNSFYECSGLEEIIVPSSVKTVGYSAFFSMNSKCKKIQILGTETVLNGSVFPMAENTLENFECHSQFSQGGFTGPCNVLKSLKFEEGIKNLDTVLSNGAINLEVLKFSSSIENIRYGSFQNLPLLRHLELPNTIKSIEYTSFNNLGISSLVIPEGINVLSGCFTNLNNLKSLEIWLDNISDNFEGSFKNLETLILNYDGVVEGLDTKYSEIRNWIKIFVPKAHIEEYKETYARISDHFYTIEISDEENIK